jgi:hypothetical protein
VQGGAWAGDGLFVDCITPIMRGFARPRRSNKPLPQIDGQLVADCKAQNPNFGQRTTLPSQASEPSARVSPLPQAASPQLTLGGAAQRAAIGISRATNAGCSAPAARDSANGPCAAAQ